MGSEAFGRGSAFARNTFNLVNKKELKDCSTEPVRVAFMGSDAIALPMLRSLGNELAGLLSIEAIFTQPDRRRGRGMTVAQNPIKVWALESEIPVMQPATIDEEQEAWLSRHGIDLVLVMAYGHILKQPFLDLPSRGIFNFHASLLPAYRGASPIEGAIACGESKTGITFMGMVKRLDAGPVLDREEVAIGKRERAIEVRESLARATAVLALRCIPRLLSGELVALEQEERLATFTRRLTREDGALDFSASAETLIHRVRALQPWPGSFFQWRKMRIKVGGARGVTKEPVSASPGVVIGERDAALAVSTGNGVIGFTLLQRPGSRMMAAGDFLRGMPISEGTQLPLLTMLPLVGTKPFPRH